ncbi:hypothetical protein NM688_g902 [Phlebia brevispora]|uniref:Uncharacterized protein n=1 Tax=Phlebia brevispora TaxID=194682 RepID=A0ACC1TCT1_9APHY|nr:hypothetical protein NM688_g902 [Phlebia brevispora]
MKGQNHHSSELNQHFSCQMFSQTLACFLCALYAVAVATSVVARENIKLPLRRHLNLTGHTIVESDRARALSLRAGHLHAGTKSSSGARSIASAVITNTAVSYTAEVQIGSPAHSYTLLLDTASSFILVGISSDNPYVKTSTSKDTGQEISTSNRLGSFFGEEFLDTVTIGDLTVTDQPIVVVKPSEGSEGVDGILGLGPDDLTEGSVPGGESIPTFIDTAFLEDLIPAKVLGISFEPTTSLSAANGELTFGGVDPTRFTGSIKFVPITSTSPSNEFVGIDQSLSYAGRNILTSSGIVDTGTTLLLIATDAFSTYQAAVGATLDPITGLLQITSEQFADLQPLIFTIGGQIFEFTPNAQLWPRALNAAVGGEADGIYLIVNDLGTPSGEGLDFINGMVFLERFYTVFDSGTPQFGIATTLFTDATTN